MNLIKLQNAYIKYNNLIRPTSLGSLKSLVFNAFRSGYRQPKREPFDLGVAYIFVYIPVVVEENNVWTGNHAILLLCSVESNTVVETYGETPDSLITLWNSKKFLETVNQKIEMKP